MKFRFRLVTGRDDVAKRRTANREKFWRQVLKRRAGSGMTIEDFCAREGLKATTYHYWQRVIRRRDDQLQSRTADRAEMRPELDKVAALAAVQLVDDERHGGAVEIVAKNGYVVRVGEQATTEHVRRVLQAVSELG